MKLTIFVSLGLLCACEALCAAPDALPAKEDWFRSAVKVATAAIEATHVGTPPYVRESEIDISPDGRLIVYAQIKANVAENRYTASLWRTDRSDPANPVQIASLGLGASTDQSSFQPRFSPDGALILFLLRSAGGQDLMIHRVADGTNRRLALIAPNESGLDVRSIRQATWSPDGRHVALTIMRSEPAQEILHGMETDTEWAPHKDRLYRAARSQLAMVELSSGLLAFLSSDGVSVEDYDWSPDGRQLVISASAVTTYDRQMLTDLYLVDVQTKQVSPLVEQAGPELRPRWSPDGRRIAFLTQGGVIDWDQVTRIGVIDLESRKVSYPGAEQIAALSGGVSQLLWSRDGRSLLMPLSIAMTSQLFGLSLPDGKLTRMSSDPHSCYGSLRASRDGRWIAFTRESFAEPRELFVMARGSSAETRLTHSNPDLRLPRNKMRIVDWPSTDRKWTIHGALIEPMKDSNPHASPPMIVYIEGGPNMAWLRYGITSQFPLHALMSQGVAVLVPNTRGRGGYGRDFSHAIRDTGDIGPGPLSDLLGGVDHVTNELALVDAARVGLAGHSYGGYLAAFALTRTTRFRSVSISEAGFIDLLPDAYQAASNKTMRDLGMGTVGLRFDPFDPAAREKLILNSPLYSLHRATTPTLLEFGDTQGMLTDKAGLPLFQGLRYFGVPSEFIRYPRTGHVWIEPALRLDSARRNIEWFGHWALGQSTQRMLDRYGPQGDQRVSARH